ncbi:MAG: PfkB family carbohydrate kinase [Sediminibacterium sp.]|nr:PfkB family carbohydrate kinase [Sediminibacterium sp.]
MSLTVVGTVAFDGIESPFGKRDKIIGGSALYIALSAIHYSKVNLISVVGYDFPEKDLLYLKEKGVDISGVQLKSDEKTFFWSCRYHEDMNHRDTISTEINCLGNFVPHVPENYQKSEFLLLGNLAPKIQTSVIQQYKVRPKFIALDTMNYWISSFWNDLLEVLAQIDCLIINDSEVRQISGKNSLIAAAKQIHTLGPKVIIIKKGEHGALVFYNEEKFYAPAIPLEIVFDPTGAGDCFAGAFMGYLAQQNNWDFSTIKKAIIHGSSVASFGIEKFGIERLLDLTYDEILTRTEDFKKLVHF